MSRLPKSFLSTPEEDEYFARERAASNDLPEEEQEAPEEADAEADSTPDETPEEDTAADDDSASDETDSEADSDESDEPSEEPEGKRSRTVPIGALHEEREKRKQLQSKVEQMEQTFARLMERVNQQSVQPPAPVAPPVPEPAIPSYDEDPVAHLKARIDQLTQLSTGTHQQIQQQTAMNKFVEALGSLENQMRAQTPDYDAAIEFAKRGRDAELAALGYHPEQRMEMMRQEILSTAATCMQRGQNPVEAFYNYAKVRGWQGPQPQKPVAPPATPAKKLATVAKAASASKSLPRGGEAPRSAISLADLATMDDAAFDKHFDRVMRKG